MAVWKVEYEPQVEKELRRDFVNGRITSEDIALLKTWALEIEEHGPGYVQKSKLWDDHPLEKEWAGHRSSCFSLKGRIIYRLENERVVVKVVRITPAHDYKRGKQK